MKFIELKSVYIGGPISLNGTATIVQVKANLEKFAWMEKHLQELGLSVFSPHGLPKFNRFGEKSSQADYLEQCFWMIMQSDGMIALDGWQESHGTLREILVTQAAGKPVFTERFFPLGYTIDVVVVEAV